MEPAVEYVDLEQLLANYSWIVVGVSSLLLTILAAISLIIKKPSKIAKTLLFGLMCFITIGSTVYLSGSTVYLNVISDSKGPVHWHTDFEVWSCGQELELIDPANWWENKVGTATLHEHNDKRIHLEGVVVHKTDASLGKFLKVVGGNLSNDQLIFPSNDGLITLKSGDSCPNGQTAQLQGFVYKVTDGAYKQEKLTDLPSYIISAESVVPPGDCVIIELDSPKDKTDKLCRSFKVAEQIHKVRKGD